jgi:hypothetical protein
MEIMEKPITQAPHPRSAVKVRMSRRGMDQFKNMGVLSADSWRTFVEVGQESVRGDWKKAVNLKG